MKAFLGLASYYQCFIPHFTEVTSPLMAISKGKSNNPIKWEDLCLKDFQKTKKSLCLDMVLKHPNFMHPFILQTDVYNQAVGAMLSQMDRVDWPIAYTSYKLNPHEQRYTTIEQECLNIK